MSGDAYETLASIGFEQPVAEIVVQHHERPPANGVRRRRHGNKAASGDTVARLRMVVS